MLMKMKFPPITLVFVFLLLVCDHAAIGSSRGAGASCIQAKTIGMGGAYTAVAGGPASIVYNPASLELYRYPKAGRFTLFINPIGAEEGLRDRKNLNKACAMRGLDWLNYAGMFLKAIVYSRPNFSAAILLTEELPGNPAEKENKELITSDGLLNWNFGVMTCRMHLAKQISIGASGYLITARGMTETGRKYGASYGIRIQPSAKFAVGVVYFDFPREVAGLFFTDNRIIDETVNIGASYKPFSALLLAADLRNANEEERTITRELHLGMNLLIFSFLSLQSGYFHTKDENRDVYSLGVSLLNSDLFHSAENQFLVPDFTINYAVRMKTLHNSFDYNHYLTIAIRI
jgi:hypothetical protein